MVERFLFDGVDILGDEFAIGMGIENAILILPDIADTEFSFRDQAVVVAQETEALFGDFYKEVLLSASVATFH
jgi:hypothetical protein